MTNWLDMTLSKAMMDKVGITEDGLRKWLLENINGVRGKAAFTLEEGMDGYMHYQVRTNGKATMQEAIAVWSRVGHVSATHAKDFDYVLKDGGGWRSWVTALERYRDITLYPWQTEAKERLAMQSDRGILVIIDEIGGAGKSYLARHCEVTGIAKVIPKMDRAGDMISAVMVNPSDAYIFDIPRSDDKQSKALWTAIEQIKNGHLYDWRYQYREVWVEPPRIMVFSNTEPPWGALSKDRWETIRLGEEAPRPQ